MSHTAKTAAETKTYTKAVKRGDYDLYVGNLFGKYDNIRVYWEDQLTRFLLRPYVAKLVEEKRKKQKKVRIVDLGCGSGQGMDVLTKIDKRNLDLSLENKRVLEKSMLEVYLGIDLSQAMVDKGNELFSEEENIRFRQMDLRDGLKVLEGEAPFDIYFSSYGSLSHLSRKHLTKLLIDISKHSKDKSLIVLDLLGRNSIEWPDYWSIDPDKDDEFQDYSMSYLNSEFGLEDPVDYFPIRFWSGKEIDAFTQSLNTKITGNFKILKKFDRSIMVGRHVDTGEYNPKLKPIRRRCNKLHEDYMRTDFHDLIIDHSTFAEHPDNEINSFFNNLVRDWNLLVKFCINRLEKNTSLVEIEDWSDYSSALQFAIMTMDRVINDTGWMWEGDPRANIIEPQLGYALRSLEASMQIGAGCGHGLIVVLQIEK